MEKNIIHQYQRLISTLCQYSLDENGQFWTPFETKSLSKICVFGSKARVKVNVETEEGFIAMIVLCAFRICGEGYNIRLENL